MPRFRRLIDWLFRTEPDPPAPPPTPPGNAGDLLSAVNAWRVAHGRKALQVSPCLTTKAAEHAMTMAVDRSMNHRFAQDRLSACGMTSGAENVAAGQRSIVEVIHAWETSSGHRSNMLGDYEYGGAAGNSGYYCLILGS